MRFSARYLPAVLLTLLSLAPSLCAQSTAKQAVRVPRGSVSGRVTIKEKGIPGVAVGLRKGDLPNAREPFLKAITDQDGFYRVANLAPGSYLITASAPAFVSNETRGMQFKSVLVGEDENVEGINFSLVRGGVITGRVTDADGRPVIEQHVHVYPADGFERQFPERAIFSMGSAPTDDRGIYRIFGLSPGSYKVAAGRSDDASMTTFNERTLYRQVFYPNVTEHAKATTIEVTEGSEASNVDIALGRALQTFSASGVVIETENRQPVPNLRFSFQRRIGQRIEFVNSMLTTNNRGEFVVEGLIPGKYAPYLIPSQAGDLRAELFSFDIVDQDVSGITIPLTKGTSMSGVIVLENEDKTLFAKLSELQLRAMVMTSNSTGGTFGSSASSPIGPDGSFRLAGLPGGTINLSLAILANPLPAKGFTITRIERDGVVAAASRLEVKEGEQLTGVRVIVTYGNATLRGVVKFVNGSQPEGARIFLRLMKLGESVQMNARSVMVDARGHFLLEGIIEGSYELSTTVAGGAPGRPPRIVTQEVSLQEGTVTDATVTFDMSVPVKP